MKLKAGDILNCYSNGLLSKIIRKVTKSKFNHTALVVEIWGEIYVIDSQRDGTNLRKLNDWDKKFGYKYVIARPKPNIYSIKEISRKALSKSGDTPYDFKGLIDQLVYNTTGKWIGRSKKRAEKRMYCSEFVAWVFDFDKFWELSPKKVFEIVLNSKNFTILQ